jgi:uncharacterized membrane protein
MRFNDLDEGKYFFTIEKIVDAARQPIFKVIAAVFAIYWLLSLGYLDNFYPQHALTVGVWQEILSSLAGVLATIVVTTYSIKLLLVQLTSQQFSPRVIRVLLKSSERTYFFGLYIGALVCNYALKIALGGTDANAIAPSL